MSVTPPGHLEQQVEVDWICWQLEQSEEIKERYQDPFENDFVAFSIRGLRAGQGGLSTSPTVIQGWELCVDSLILPLILLERSRLPFTWKWLPESTVTKLMEQDFG